MRKITTMEAGAVLALLAVLPLSLRAVELNEVDVTLLPQLVGRGNGYTEIGFSLTNRSPEVKQVGLTLEAAYNYGRGLNRLSRKVTLPPESSMKVSLWQPPLAMNNPQLTIEVNGRVFTPDKHNLQPGTSGNFGRNTVILLSQQVPGNSGKFYQGPAGSYSGGIEYQMSSMPVAQWSKYALAYSGVPMIMLTGRDWKEMPEEVKNALLQYADLGGVILLIGVEAPERAVLLNEYWRRENVGFGYLLYSSIEPEAFSESDWQYLERDWQRFQNTVNDNAMKNSGNLFRALLSIDSNNFPAVPLMLVMVVFAIIVGPVNYIVLMRRKRLMLLLVTTPLISLVFAGLIVGYAFVAEGWGIQQGIHSMTYLDEIRQQAATIGNMGIYGAVSPDGLKFSEAMELRFGEGTADSGYLQIDDSAGQLLTGSWFVPRLPGAIAFRKAENRLERLKINPLADGSLEVVNGLGGEITFLAIKMPDRKAYESATPLPGGARAVLWPKEGGGVSREFELRDNFLHGWNSFRQPSAEQLPAGNYYAELVASPFIETGFEAGKLSQKAAVFGHFAEEEKTK